MKKDCFEQDFVNAEKFRECAECKIYEQCTEAVYAKEASTVSAFGQSIGLTLGIVGVIVSAFMVASHAFAATWGMFLSVIYIMATFKAGKEARERYGRDLENQKKSAEAVPDGA